MELIDANFSSEKSKLLSIDQELSEKINNISKTVSGMSNYWQDSKSNQLISDVTQMLSNLSTEKTKVIESGKSLLDDVAKQLNSLYE